MRLTWIVTNRWRNLKLRLFYFLTTWNVVKLVEDFPLANDISRIPCNLSHWWCCITGPFRDSWKPHWIFQLLNVNFSLRLRKYTWAHFCWFFTRVSFFLRITFSLECSFGLFSFAYAVALPKWHMMRSEVSSSIISRSNTSGFSLKLICSQQHA